MDKHHHDQEENLLCGTRQDVPEPSAPDPLSEPASMDDDPFAQNVSDESSFTSSLDRSLSRTVLQQWVLPIILICLLPPGLYYLFFVYREQTTLFETAVAVVLIGFFLYSMLEFILATRKLRLSKTSIHEAMKQSESWDKLRFGNDRHGSWFNVVVNNLKTRRDADRISENKWRNVALPQVDEVVLPAQAQAEGAALYLRWLSTAAVLIGLIGTLWGLIDAIREALLLFQGKPLDPASVTAAVPSADLASLPAGTDSLSPLLKQLGRALSPIQFCFVSSIGGISTSFCLSLLRHVYENALDKHFADISFGIQCHLHDFYEGWTAPEVAFSNATHQLTSTSMAIEKSSGKIEEVSEGIHTLASNIKTSTEEILKKATDLFSEQLLDQLENIRKTIGDGVTNGTEAALVRIRDAEDGVRQAVFHEGRELIEDLRLLQKSILDEHESIRTTLQDVDTAKREVAQWQSDIRELLATERTTFAGVADTTKQMLEGVQPAMQGVTAALNGIGTNAAELAYNANKVHGTLQEDAKALTGLPERLSTLGSAMSGHTEKLQAIVEGFPTLLRQEEGAMNTAVAQAIDKYAATFSSGNSTVQQALEAYRHQFDDAVAKSNRLLEEVKTALEATATSLGAVNSTAAQLVDGANKVGTSRGWRAVRHPLYRRKTSWRRA